MREQLEQLPAKLETAKENLAKIQSDTGKARAVADMEELPFDNKRIHAQVSQAIANFKKGETTPISIGTVGGFAVSVKAAEVVRTLGTTEIMVTLVVNGEAEYSCEAGRNETDNNVVRLKNLFARIIPTREEVTAGEIERLTENIAQAKSQIDVPFEYEAKIAELQQTLAELDEKLSGITKQQDVVADDDELDVAETAETAETKEQKAKREEIYNVEEGDYQPVPDTPDNDDDEPGTPRRGRSA
jgi:DNA repair exonuclease SbcCD ATPase subunit